MKKAITNSKIILTDKIIEGKALLIDGNKITAIVDNNSVPNEYNVIDAEGNYLSPGFIDIHAHGGGGFDFMDGDEEAFLGVSAWHAKFGTTSMLATTLASTNEELKRSVAVFNKVKTMELNGANLLGFNLEGPFFSLAQCGAQDPKYITPPNPQLYNEVMEMSDDIIMWCSAPELEGSEEFARALVKKGIIPSIAHTDAVYEDVVKACNAGYRHVTHLYSGMGGIKRINSYRFAGVVESAFLIDDLTVEVIADGCHLPACLLKLIYKIKGPDKISLITDATRGAGMPDGGEIMLGSKTNGVRAIIEDGVAKLPDRLSFAGSVATADRLVRNMIQLAEVDMVNAVKMMTATPASIIGAKTKGIIAEGYDADVIIFDKNINVKKTVVGGRIVFESDK
ncbi:MAG: N-acetylglucosamine-6-phosphate deacetylase [Clostridiales bacterium]|nr:N-acetylglucosamine-6-phosphate deacetylase [Clostridiales bacterium]